MHETVVRSDARMEMGEIGNIKNPLDLIEMLQNPPTHINTSFELRKMSVEYPAHMVELKGLPMYENMDDLLVDAEKIYEYLNKK